MRVGQLSPLLLLPPGGKTTAAGPGEGTLTFGQILRQKLQEVSDLQKQADQLTSQFLAGGNVELHQVMLAVEQAGLALQLTMQVRNKLVEAYQEIARMQI